MPAYHTPPNVPHNLTHAHMHATTKHASAPIKKTMCESLAFGIAPTLKPERPTCACPMRNQTDAPHLSLVRLAIEMRWNCHKVYPPATETQSTLQSWRYSDMLKTTNPTHRSHAETFNLCHMHSGPTFAWSLNSTEMKAFANESTNRRDRILWIPDMILLA